MNNHKLSFSLFSFCIYLSLIVILISIVFPIFLHISTDIMRIAHNQRIALELSKTIALIACILKYVDPQKIAHHDSHMLVWEKEEYNQGIFFDKKMHTLYFVEGIFDANKIIWKEKKKSLLSYHITFVISFSNIPLPLFDITCSYKKQSISYQIIPTVRKYILKKENTV